MGQSRVRLWLFVAVLDMVAEGRVRVTTADGELHSLEAPTLSKFVGPQKFALSVNNVSSIVRVKKKHQCSLRKLREAGVVQSSIVIAKRTWKCDLEKQHARLARIGASAWITIQNVYRVPGFHMNYHYYFRATRKGRGPPLVSIYGPSHTWTKVRKVAWTSLSIESSRNRWRRVFESPYYQAMARGILGGCKLIIACVALKALRNRLSAGNSRSYVLPLASLLLEAASMTTLSAFWIVGSGYADGLLPFWGHFTCMTGLTGCRLGSGVCLSLFWLEMSASFNSTTFVRISRESRMKLGTAAFAVVIGIVSDVTLVAADVRSQTVFLAVYTFCLLVLGSVGLVGGVVFLLAVRRALRDQRASSISSTPSDYRNSSTFDKLSHSFRLMTWWFVLGSGLQLLFVLVVILLLVNAAKANFTVDRANWVQFMILLDLPRTASSYCFVMALDFKGDLQPRLSHLGRFSLTLVPPCLKRFELIFCCTNANNYACTSNYQQMMVHVNTTVEGRRSPLEVSSLRKHALPSMMARPTFGGRSRTEQPARSNSEARTQAADIGLRQDKVDAAPGSAHAPCSRPDGVSSQSS